jgi:hypothetical protein
MYERLTLDELSHLQGILFDGSEKAYEIANLHRQNRSWLNRYGPVHSEVGRAFLEAGQELAGRLDAREEASAA